MTADVEEVVEYADPIDFQNLAPDLRDHFFDLAARRDKVIRYRVDAAIQGGERQPIDFAVGRKRHGF